MPREVLSALRLRFVADKSEGERVPMMVARPVEVLDDGRVLIDPSTGVERILFNPATPEIEHESWPLLGVEPLDVLGKTPKRTRISGKLVQRGIAEGWLEAEGEQLAHRPGGPADNRWRVTHTFVHYDRLVFKTPDGDLAYRVVRQPDKFVARVDDDGAKLVRSADAEVTEEIYAAGETAVEHVYELELEG